MEKLFYIASTRITSKVADLVDKGYPIVIGETTYERLTKRPLGRKVLKRLMNPETNVQITIFS